MQYRKDVRYTYGFLVYMYLVQQQCLDVGKRHVNFSQDGGHRFHPLP